MSAWIRPTALELYRHHKWQKEPHTEHIRGPTISSDRSTIGRVVEIKEGDNRGEGMGDADRAQKKGKNGRKEKRPKTLATQGRGNVGAMRGLHLVIAH